DYYCCSYTSNNNWVF
nr:immunoglobulin light chain junction region [Macaca mulatta]MOW28081.1 immunoglobulin light chain junction region [Macaca mulatta]MOW29302.1 immunoglobulin light chain junction region [Macaca mulatta]MOW30059.1 immunoglobulin light chain junction region [Macaca mulatta]